MDDCSFVLEDSSEVAVCTARPDCQAGHDYLLAELSRISPFFLLGSTPISSRIKGNLGEFVAFCVGRDLAFRDYRPFPANALAPLQDISKPDVDIVWLFLPDGDSAGDLALLQEVKTTGDSKLDYVGELITDYRKMFGTDPRLTLHTRLQDIKNRVQYTMKRKDLCSRISRLAGSAPLNSPRVRLLPTAVHEKDGSDPIRKMLSIRETLVGMGWSNAAVEPWSISLTNLDDRLNRLAHGRN